MNEIALRAIAVVRAAQYSDIDGISIDKLREAIKKEYPLLGDDWPYPWRVSKEAIIELVKQYPSK